MRQFHSDLDCFRVTEKSASGLSLVLLGCLNMQIEGLHRPELPEKLSLLPDMLTHRDLILGESQLQGRESSRPSRGVPLFGLILSNLLVNFSHMRSNISPGVCKVACIQ